MPAPPRYLLVRPQDLVVLGIDWRDAEAHAVEGAIELRPSGDRATLITLTLPPQAIAEEKLAAGDTAVRRARAAGPSRLAFRLAAGATVRLTPDGLLAALTGPGTTLDPADPGTVELPWRLWVSPRAAAGGDVVAFAAAAPAPTGAAGVWWLRLAGLDGSASDARLRLEVADADGDDAGLDIGPLWGQDRQNVRLARTSERPRATRLEVTALGGALSASVRTPGFDWDHETRLGRDQHVRVVTRGVLHPTGHRAAYVEVAERALDPGASSGVAGLGRRTMLVVTEPVRDLRAGELEDLRRFPFHEVEALDRTVPGTTLQLTTVPRPVTPPADLQAAIDALTSERQGIHDLFAPAYAVEPQSLEAWIQLSVDAGGGTGFALREAEWKAARDPDEMRRRRADHEVEKRNLELLLTPPTGPPDPPEPITDPPIGGRVLVPRALSADRGLDEDAIWRRIQELQHLIFELRDEVIAQVVAERPIWEGRARELRAAVQAEWQQRDTLEEWVALLAPFDGNAARAVAIGVEIADLNRRIAAIAALTALPVPAYGMPADASGRPLPLRFRCAGAAGDVVLAMPVVFVRDETLPAAEDAPAWSAAADPEVRSAVAELWARRTGGGRVAVPPARVDMVRSGVRSVPQGDLQMVRALHLAATDDGYGFRPRLEAFEADLPALRALPGTLTGSATLTFTEEFLRSPVIPEVPFALPQVAVDFLGQAERAGGLAVPRFAVDGVSRTLGAVARDALPATPVGAAQAFAAVFRDTTLLGMPLAELLRLPSGPPVAGADALPLPPEIVEVAEGGVPDGVRMSWRAPLKAFGPFRPGPDTRLELSVTQTRSLHETRCEVGDFRLVFPPGAEPLLALAFRRLRFTQGDGRPPDLEVEGVRLDLGGALTLLRRLQELLQEGLSAPGGRPPVDVRPDGLTATFGFVAPRAAAGVFLMRDIAMRLAVDVPFRGDPVTVTLAFASRGQPFTVSVLGFGGAGYVELTFGPEGVTSLEASIECGAYVEIDFVIARGEVHAAAGMRLSVRGGTPEFEAFVRIGGSVEVLGLVSVAIELAITLRYEAEGNRLIGRATILVEIDLTLYSDTIAIDSGEWVLAGGGEEPAGRPVLDATTFALDEGRDARVADAWSVYRRAFAVT
ncbi:MAG TPA: hypothetical protein VNT51_05295 [Miltoncostaeaceae bacterium]|nr:hypothetical protein [Miltoncostaeaceae bacterium]